MIVVMEKGSNEAQIQAISDGAQSLTPKRFKALMGELERVARAVGRNLH
jgi:3-deoxy-D-arabino-heptulosonate 7-phosphate (DAHP) synthase